MTPDEVIGELAGRLLPLELRFDAVGDALPVADKARLRGRIEGLREALELLAGRPADDILRERSFPEA